MMESCLSGMRERAGPVGMDDIRRDLLDDFTALPAQDSIQSENLQVYLRIRPLTAAEGDSGGSQGCVTIEGPDTVVLKAPRSSQSNQQSQKTLPQTAQRFTFTQVFGPEASQRTVFEGTVRGLVRDVLDGGNCLVFTYGVTNAGKTFTFLGPDHNSGLLPRSLSVIFNSIEGRLYGRTDLKPQRCRDYSRLTPDQQAAERTSKKNLLRLLKESDKSLTSTRSMLLNGSSISTDGSVNSVSDTEGSLSLDVAPNVHFSIWVSFCEIYNDNIHDLLEQVPSGHHKRTVLRLSQDVKGNSFIKDLRWVQVNSFDEAYRVMKIGRKNQSFSATKLNQLSSRSHSIFSIRILRVDNVGVTRVLGISELALCDLAGSERCSRTHNTGERLKEAGNINSSLLTLGKCITAMRLNEHAKFQHHIPFRESKLTHFLQFFFCGAGRVSMVVNINQNASCFDETLNVLKFSALAQKVVVLNSRPVVLDDTTHRSAMELSMIIDKADQRRNVSGRSRKSSMVAWEMTLEDILEDEDGEDWEEEEQSVVKETVLETGNGTIEEGEKSNREAALRLVLEAQIREEVYTEFMELFSKMERDYRENLEKEREILEERADKRIKILKNLISTTAELPVTAATNNSKEEQVAVLEGIISSLTEDLEKIREDAQNVQHCLKEHTHTEELEVLRLEKQQSHTKLQEAKESLEQQQQKLSELMEICLQKDDIINKLQAAMDATVEDATRDSALVERIRSELQQTCCCLRRTGGEEEEVKEDSPKCLQESLGDEEDRGPARKRVVLEEEIWRLQEENDKKEEIIAKLRERQEMSRGLEEELRRREAEVGELKKARILLEQRVERLTVTPPLVDLDECPNCDSVFSSLESERRETSRLTKENKALINGIFQLQIEVTNLQTLLKQKTDMCDSQSEQFSTAQTHLQELDSQSEEKAESINSLMQEVEHLRQVKPSNSSSVFHTATEELEKESQVALERLAQKSQQIQDLQQEKRQLQKTLTHSESRCAELREEAANWKAEFAHQLQSLRAEHKSESEALQARLEEMEREQDRERKELGHLKEDLQRKGEEEKENRGMEESKVSVVEELKKEIQLHQEGRRPQEEDRSRECVAVKREVERLQRQEERDTNSQGNTQRYGEHALPEEGVNVSTLRSNMADRKKIVQTTGRKRKSFEMEELVFSENMRKRLRENSLNNKWSSVVKEKRDGNLQKIEDLIQSSPSILGREAKNIINVVSGCSLEETQTTKLRQGRKKLCKTSTSSLLLYSPPSEKVSAGAEKESAHLTIKRQLRSKTSRK